MKLVDLTLSIYSGMPVYPGDPEASVEVIQTLEKNCWEMRRLQMNTHDGTHVNAPSHGMKGGKTLDDYPLSVFFGPAVIYKSAQSLTPDKGVLFRDQNIDTAMAAEILKARPRFVGLSSDYEIDVGIEKNFLKADILLFERLCNLGKLPDTFDFFGMPLKIKHGDGSPVRAFAIII